MIIAAGPWIGEFGYELFKWQSYLRALSDMGHDIYVSSRPGHDALYSDFARGYYPYSVPTDACSGRDNFAASGMYSAVKAVFRDIPYDDLLVLKKFGSEPQRFVAYGQKSDNSTYDIIMHVRNVGSGVLTSGMGGADKKCARNGTREIWNILEDRFILAGLRVACIGSRDASLHLDGTDDLRGISLKELADVLASSTVIVGPSSGPMHFAALCRCRQVVWGTPYTAICRGDLVRRYTRDWNPFNTPSVFITTGDDWVPSPEKVCSAVAAAIR